MSQLIRIALFAWQRQRVLILVGLLSFLIAGVAYSNRERLQIVSAAQSTLETSGLLNTLTAAFSFATLIVAVLVWWGEMQEDWEESLPKRLRVIFVFDDKPVIVCEDATLIAETDMRALAQQIGAQINSQRNLVITPEFMLRPVELVHSSGGWFRRFQIQMVLGKLPEVVEAKRLETQDAELYCIRALVNGKWENRWSS